MSLLTKFLTDSPVLIPAIDYFFFGQSYLEIDSNKFYFWKFSSNLERQLK